ncbi:MAG: hypothetical protein L0387_10805 [Acidobacteria bacterium]|nr:hypothetical protein [Acidobacteriota bacterium]
MKKELACATVLLAMALAASGQAGQKVEDPATKKKVQAAVEQYVKDEAQLKGGFFLRDSAKGEVRDLKFDYVHQGLEKTAAGEYAVCVDFLDQSKRRLDVDFWLKPTASGDLQVSKIRVHKVNGVEQKGEGTGNPTKQ